MDTPERKVQKQKRLSIFDFNDEFEDEWDVESDYDEGEF